MFSFVSHHFIFSHMDIAAASLTGSMDGQKPTTVQNVALNWPQLTADYSWFQWLSESPNWQELWLSPTLCVRDRLGTGRGWLRVFNGGEKASDLRPLRAGHGVHQVSHCIHGNMRVLLQHPAHTNWQRHKTPGTNRNIKLAFFSSQESFTLFNIIWV